MKPIRLALLGLAMVTLAVLTGCIESPYPLLDERDAIADPSLAGHYAVTGFLSDKPALYDVYLKDSVYVIAIPPPETAFMVGTLHPFRDHTFIAQLRQKGKDSYAYALVRKSSSRIELNWFACSSECEIRDEAHLRRLADAADAKFSGGQNMVGVRTGDAE